MDVRLPTMPFLFDGKEFTLCCNMNVLADDQEAYGGSNMKALLNPSSIKASMAFLAAMLNDCAETNGWEERYTPRQVGRMLGANPENVKLVTGQIGRFIRQSMTQRKPEDIQEAAEKN